MLRHVIPISLLVAILLLAPLGAASPYFLITPGGTYDIDSRLRIPDEFRKLKPPGHHLAFTAVYEQEASWSEVAHARLAGLSEIVPAVAVRPPGTSQEQLNATNKRLIDESKLVAAVVALRAAGYPVSITGQGAEVESIIEGMPAQGALQVGDVITAVDGLPVTTIDSLIANIRRHQVGEHVLLTIRRDGQDQDAEVGTRESPIEPGRPVVGVTVSTYLFDVQMPFQIDIESDDVGGPSAGFMFALGILDAVTDGDLTRGYYVAGTGTIAQDGTVGGVGGAAEKALAAEQDGAQVFLVPNDDAEEAHRWIHTLQIVPVERFDDAVRALCVLSPAASAPSPDQPAACG